MKKIDFKKINLFILIINIIIFIIFLLLIIFYFYPKITFIEEKKDNLSVLLDEYNRLKKEGLNYEDFKKIKSDNLSLENKKILGKIERVFYNKNFLNNKGEFLNYEDFLDNLKEKINEKLKDDYEEKYKKIYQVLPVYSDFSNDVNKEDVLTDFKFVNMIENLLNDYNLSTKNDIGIKYIEKLDDFDKEKVQGENANIYVISLPLTIEGTKANIIKFLNRIYKFGKVVLENKNGEGELHIINPNIFSEVEFIGMKEYIDSSTSLKENNTDLVNLILNTQKNEKFEIDVKILFYVQGLPNYKMKEEILNVIGTLPPNFKDSEIKNTNYGYLNSRLKILQNKYRNNKLVLEELKDIESYLRNINKDIVKLNKRLLNSKNLLMIYNKVKNYKRIFEIINKKLDKIESLNK